MHALLARKAALNISKKAKVEEQCTFEGFSSPCSDYISSASGNKACFNSDDGYVFARPVKVTPKNGNPVDGVYMVVGGCYLVEFPTDFDVSKEARTVEASSSAEDKEYSGKQDNYLVTKKEADLNLKVKVEYTNIKPVEDYYVFDSVAEIVEFYVLNPNKFSAQADVDDTYYVSTENDDKEGNPMLITKSNKKVSDLIFAHLNIRSYEDGEPDLAGKDTWEFSASTTVEIKGNDLGSFPEKTWKIKSGIFTKDTPDDDLPGKGLSAGAIAGIVIACVVVVGVVVFCIVWFVVLKKGCCCGNGSKNSDAEA